MDPELATTARADVEAKKQAKLIDTLAAELDGIYLITPGSRWQCLVPLIERVNELR